MSLSKLAYKIGYQIGKTYTQIKHKIQTIWQCWCNPPQTEDFALAMEILAR